jgi:cell division protein FtsB
LLWREYGVTAARLSQWRETFLTGGQTSLKEHPLEERDVQMTRLQAKVGELTMANELLEHQIDQLEQGRPFRRRRLTP